MKLIIGLILGLVAGFILGAVRERILSLNEEIDGGVKELRNKLDLLIDQYDKTPHHYQIKREKLFAQIRELKQEIKNSTT